MQNRKFLNRLLDGIDLENVDPVYTTILGTIKKYELLETNEKYTVDGLFEILQENKLVIVKDKLLDKLVTKYIYNATGIDLKAEVSICELCVELLYNLSQANNNIIDIDEIGKTCDINKIKPSLESLANNGDGRAAYYLAFFSKQKDEREKWLNIGIQARNCLCKSLYFRCFSGELSKDDYDKVYSAANENDFIAQYEMFLLLAEGCGNVVEKDVDEAINWLKKAAEQEYAPAQDSLGDCYDIGRGVKEDCSEAQRWYMRAIKHGYTPIRAKYCVEKFTNTIMRHNSVEEKQ